MGKERKTGCRVWLGRVFCDGLAGGNHTAIVTDARRDEMQRLAQALGVADTGFVIARDADALTLRTFSPHEELAQCTQTALAAVVATGTPAGKTVRVRHEQGEELQIASERTGGENLVWIDDDIEQALPAREIENITGLRAESTVRTDDARPRVYQRLPSVASVQRVEFERGEVLRLCEGHGVNGVVLYACDGRRVYARTFTTSLAGGEDAATGGAALRIGRLLARHGRRGEFDLVQGRAGDGYLGYFKLRLDDVRIRLGGRVVELVEGRLLL